MQPPPPKKKKKHIPISLFTYGLEASVQESKKVKQNQRFASRRAIYTIKQHF